MPKTFLTRNIHVAETDELAREEAEQNLIGSNPAVGDVAGVERLGDKKVGYGDVAGRLNTAGTPEREELMRVFQQCAISYDFWIDNGIAIVGSPETVIAKIQAQHQLIGHDIFSARHRFGRMSEEFARKSLRLFGREVMPAFNGSAR